MSRAPRSSGSAPVCANATQPTSDSVHSCASVLPFRPAVSAPSGYSRAPAASRERCLSIRTRPGSSSGGSVSGGHTIPVTPPASAARISMRSAPSAPGSRMRAHRSIGTYDGDDK